MSFKKRHLDYNSIKEIEPYLGKTKEELVNDTIPEQIRNEQLDLEELSEQEFLTMFKDNQLSNNDYFINRYGDFKRIFIR